MRRGTLVLLVGGAALVGIAIVAMIGIWFTPYDPTAFAVRVRLAASDTTQGELP